MNLVISILELILVVSFVLLAVQYYLIYPESRVFVPRVGLMLAIFILMWVTAIHAASVPLLVLVLLTLVCLGLSVYLHWRMLVSRRPAHRTKGKH